MADLRQSGQRGMSLYVSGFWHLAELDAGPQEVRTCGQQCVRTPGMLSNPSPSHPI